MHHTLRKLKGSMIVSSDEFNIGEIRDFYFDDEKWAIRYFAVNTGSWLNQKLVLISPYAIQKIEWGGFNVRVNLSKSQIEGCPTPEDEKPVSRLYEEKYSRYYELPFYWTAGDGLWPNNIYPSIYANMSNISNKDLVRKKVEELNEQIAGNHLRSYNEVMGYRIHASDDVFGHVEDLVIEAESYKIDHLIIDTRNFLPSPSVLVPVEWITEIDWEANVLHTTLDKNHIQGAPHYHYDWPVDLDLR